MKKSDLFKIGVLLMATTLGTTGCSFGEDEKKPEIVVDPAEKTIEYYIAGKVTEGTTALSGVEVKAGEVTATTDAEGAYKLTVDSKKVYTVTFSKEGYMSIDNATATVDLNEEEYAYWVYEHRQCNGNHRRQCGKPQYGESECEIKQESSGKRSEGRCGRRSGGNR